MSKVCPIPKVEVETYLDDSDRVTHVTLREPISKVMPFFKNFRLICPFNEHGRTGAKKCGRTGCLLHPNRDKRRAKFQPELYTNWCHLDEGDINIGCYDQNPVNGAKRGWSNSCQHCDPLMCIRDLDKTAEIANSDGTHLKKLLERESNRPEFLRLFRGLMKDLRKFDKETKSSWK